MAHPGNVQGGSGTPRPCNSSCSIEASRTGHVGLLRATGNRSRLQRVSASRTQCQTGGFPDANEPGHQTRLERILGVPLAADAVRQWPQSGELVRGRQRIGEVESHFLGLRLGVGRRIAWGNTVVVEWTTDYGDGRLYRNVSIADLRDGKAVRVTDYWGEPFTPPAWREPLVERLDMPRAGTWPPAEALTGD